jgi:Icc-related predicted phosphoesterase
MSLNSFWLENKHVKNKNQESAIDNILLIAHSSFFIADVSPFPKKPINDRVINLIVNEGKCDKREVLSVRRKNYRVNEVFTRKKDRSRYYQSAS